MIRGVFILPALLVSFLSATTVIVAQTYTGLLEVEHPDFSQFEEGVQARMEKVAREVEIQNNQRPRNDPILAQAYGNLGMLYHAYALRVPAEAGYRNAHSLRPDETTWLYLLAFLMHENGDFDQSIELYRQVLEMNSDFLPARIHLAQALFATDRLDESKKEYSTSFKVEPRSAAALYGLGGIALRHQNNEAAVDYYERALAIEPAATQIHYNLAQAYRKIGDREAARHHLDLRGTTRPSVHDPILALMQAQKVTSQEYLKEGVSAYDDGRYSDAVTAYELALTLQPDDPHTHLSLAWVMELAGDKRDIMQHVDAALKLDPNYAQAHFSKGAMLEEAGDDNSALLHYREAVANDPESFPPRLLLANVLMRSGDTGEAAEQYGILATDQPGDVVLQYRLAVAYERIGNCSAAVTTIAGALQQQPGSATLMQAYVRLASSCSGVDDATTKQAYGVAQTLFQSLRNLEGAETMAMAAAANARFDQAVGLQEQVVRQLQSQGKSQVFARKNLDAYRNNDSSLAPWPTDSNVYRPERITLRDRMTLAGIGVDQGSDDSR